VPWLPNVALRYLECDFLDLQREEKEKREKTRANECDTGADVDDEGRGQAPKNMA
jgi:hypothetical protein